MLTPSSLAALRDVNIFDVISPSVKLTKKGTKYLGCCPFHDEKTPSFNVNTVKNTYKCFGCGEGGDAIAFIQKSQKLDFLEAAEALAEIGHITLEREENFNQEAYLQKKAEKKTLGQLITDVAATFASNLWSTENAAFQYLTEHRGYDKSTISYWRLGYAQADNQITRQHFGDGCLPDLLKIGISAENEQRPYDFFRNRLMFPIINHLGQIVSFGGRSLGDEKPKYLNTATTALYDKSQTLYGLYQAAKAINDTKFATIVEGYTDVISLHRARLSNAIATCGTALTEAHCALLKKHTSRVTLMRDGDEAGRKAITRDIPLLLRFGFEVSVKQLKDGQDPDDYAKEFLVNQS